MKTFPHPHFSGFSGGLCDSEQHLIAKKHHYCVCVDMWLILFILLEGKQHHITLGFLLGFVGACEAEYDSYGSLEWKCRLRYNVIFMAL